MIPAAATRATAAGPAMMGVELEEPVPARLSPAGLGCDDGTGAGEELEGSSVGVDVEGAAEDGVAEGVAVAGGVLGGVVDGVGVGSSSPGQTGAVLVSSTLNLPFSSTAFRTRWTETSFWCLGRSSVVLKESPNFLDSSDSPSAVTVTSLTGSSPWP